MRWLVVLLLLGGCKWDYVNEGQLCVEVGNEPDVEGQFATAVRVIANNCAAPCTDHSGECEVALDGDRFEVTARASTGKDCGPERVCDEIVAECSTTVPSGEVVFAFDNEELTVTSPGGASCTPERVVRALAPTVAFR